MTEDEARSWIVNHYGLQAKARISVFVDRVIAENSVQNLISPASIDTVWSRHVVDSAQLLLLAPGDWETWLDIGTGGGFPGMVVALLTPDRQVVMSEPRARRCAFLRDCAAALELSHAQVSHLKVEDVVLSADVISARAVAATEKILRSAAHCATDRTTWLLPRGRSGAEISEARSPVFHVEHSLTDLQSIILVGRGRPR